MNIELEFELEVIVQSLVTVRPDVPSAVWERLFHDEKFLKSLAKDMFEVWQASNEAEPSLALDAMADFLPPPPPAPKAN